MLKNARVLMTGVTGQVAASIGALLAPENEVHGFARFSNPQSRARVEALGMRPITGDYTSGDLSMLPNDYDYVLHLAADTFPADIDTGVRQNAEGTGRLFNHLNRAKAWIYVSTTGVYWDHPDPWYRYVETDRLGGSTRLTDRFAYGTSKFAGEAVARTMSRIHNVPVTIPRLNWSYGLQGDGGLPVMLMARLAAGEPIPAHPDWEMVGSPIHETDLAEQIEGLLAAAEVGGTIINWAGDEAVSVEQITPWIAAEMGLPFTFVETRKATAYPRATDNGKRISLVGRCAVDWRDGFRQIIREKFPAPAVSR
jgi:nucleoside-diphosphate-sugar epimerase